MKNRKYLVSLKPFNEVYYRDCYFATLIPVIKFFRRDLEPVLFNDVCYYKYSEKDKVLNILSSPIKNNSEVLKDDLGLIEARFYELYRVDEIITNIENREPVVIGVDRYYQSTCPLFFEKSHAFHYVLVRGYNLEKRSFYMIDDNYESISNTYRKGCASFEELMRCHQACIDNFREAPWPLFMHYSIKHKFTPVEKEEVLRKFVCHWCTQFDTLLKSLNEIKLFGEKLLESRIDASVCSQCEPSIWKIIQFKKADRFRFSMLVDCDDTFKPLINRWESLRKIMLLGRDGFQIENVSKLTIMRLLDQTIEYEKKSLELLDRFIGDRIR